MDDSAKKTLSSIPLLKTKAGPRDKDLWPQRLKEEYQALIQVTESILFSADCYVTSRRCWDLNFSEIDWNIIQAYVILELTRIVILFFCFVVVCTK